MDDRRAHFLIAVVELCSAARLARFEVELRTETGDLVRGVPDAVPLEVGDASGYDQLLGIGGSVIRVSTVVSCTADAPAGALDAAHRAA